jgi:hypothetical protein
MPSAVRCEKTIRRKSFAGSLADRRTSARAAGFCRWRRSAMEWTERRRRLAAWIASRCATGFIASTFRGRRASSTTGRRVQARIGQKNGLVRHSRLSGERAFQHYAAIWSPEWTRSGLRRCDCYTTREKISPRSLVAASSASRSPANNNQK